MSLLRTVMSRACNQYSCLVAPKHTGVLSTSKAHFCDRTKKEKKESSEEKTIRFDDTGKDMSIPIGMQIQAERVKSSYLRPGYGNVPDATVYEKMYNGVRFEELPTVHITSTRNNTKAYATKGVNGERMVCQKTGGSVGFKNARKSSNVAAQSVGLTLAQVLVKKKLVNVRVTLSGTGVNRLTTMRGLILGGLNIVSISDKTYPTFYNRPRKPARV